MASRLEHIILKLRVCRTTIRALEHRGLVDRFELPQRSMVRISDAGRAYLQGINSGKAKQ